MATDPKEEIVFTVRITKETFTRLRSASLVRALAGNNHGLVDAFVERFVTCVEEGKTEHLFAIKKAVD